MIILELKKMKQIVQVFSHTVVLMLVRLEIYVIMIVADRDNVTSPQELVSALTVSTRQHVIRNLDVNMTLLQKKCRSIEHM